MAENAYADLGFMADHSDLGFVPKAKASQRDETNLKAASTFIQSVGNKASFGHAPELSALVEKVIPNPSAKADAELRAKGVQIIQPEPSLAESTDAYRQKLKDLQQQNPGSAMAGNVVGSVAGGGALSALTPINALSALGRIAQGVRAGTVAGTLQNPAEDQAKTEGFQPGKRAIGGGIGAALGGGVQGVVVEGVTPVLTKLGALLAGKPAKAAEIYAERGGEVNELRDKYGGVLPAAADDMKSKVLEHIKATKKGLFSEIEGAFKDPMAPTIPSEPILARLQAAKEGLNPHYKAGDLSQIDEMINLVQKNAPDGQLSLQHLFDTRNYLQELSQGSYVKNGEIFVTGDAASKAANSARKVATDALHKSSPGIAHADSIYSDLHDLDNKMSSALLGTGKAENVFASAGGGKGNVHQMMLQKIGKITGTDPIKDAELLYAAQNMSHGSLIEGPRETILRGALDAKRVIGRPLYQPSLLGAIPTAETAVERRLNVIPPEQKKRKLGSQ